MKSAIFTVLLVLSVTVLGTSAMGYPSPAVVQGPDKWTLDVQYSQPEQILLRLDGQEKPRRFWYIILTVTNEGPEDAVPFYPAAQLVTDTFQVIDAGQRVPKGVFETIRLKHQGRYPFLESLDFTDRRIVRGVDNTRDFAIIWPDFDPKARQVSLFIAGLSNETAVIERPGKDDDQPAEKIFLRKTLHLQYAAAGDETLRADTTIKKIQSTWVMR